VRVLSELEELRKAGVDTRLNILCSLGYFDFRCRDVCPLDQCPLDVPKEKIEGLENTLGKVVVVTCPIFLDDLVEE